MRPVIILCKEENNEIFSEIYEKIEELIDEKNVLENKSIGSTQTVGKSNLEIHILNIYDWFDSYSEFDNFLINLSDDCGLNDLENRAVIAGHLDPDGILWSDYSEFANKDFENQISKEVD